MMSECSAEVARRENVQKAYLLRMKKAGETEEKRTKSDGTCV